jgi:hypothetical protein
MESLEHTRCRHEHPHEVLEAVERFSAHLAAAGYEARFFRELPARLAPAASLLPPRLPLGLSHNDFAPRNILLAADGRMTVFDTQGRWRAPIYEDLAYFLIAIQASGLQVLTGGALYDRPLLARCESAFLAGYFEDEEVPLLSLRLFACLLLLERLSALVTRHQTARGWRRPLKGCRLALWRRFGVGQLRRFVNEIETLSSP